MRIEFFERKGEYGWRLVASNGKTFHEPRDTFKTGANAVRSLQKVAAAFEAEIEVGACEGIKRKTVLRALQHSALKIVE